MHHISRMATLRGRTTLCVRQAARGFMREYQPIHMLQRLSAQGISLHDVSGYRRPLLFPSTLGLRHFCEATSEVIVVDKNYVVKAFADPEIVIIDVREDEEINETGPIEVDHREAEHIPLGQVKVALSASEESFEAEFGFEKPRLDQEIIFTCRSGVRSDMACRIAAEEGFSNVKNYKGSALEWFAE